MLIHTGKILFDNISFNPSQLYLPSCFSNEHDAYSVLYVYNVYIYIYICISMYNIHD